MYSTRTATYTIVDVRRAFEGFEADLRMIARRTEKWTMEYVDKVFHDVIVLAEGKYLSEINIALIDSAGRTVKATKFIVSADGSSISGDRAGGNDWSNIPNTTLNVILSFTLEWGKLSAQQKTKFKLDNDFQIGWVDSNIDTTFRHLTKSSAQLYASNGYELKKYNFN